MEQRDIIDFEQVEAMGVSRAASDEVMDILGHQPTIDELSTLLAMWEANGRQQSLYAWLCGQQHATRRDDYIYHGNADHRELREPRVKECLEVATTLGGTLPDGHHVEVERALLYMVGNVSAEFVGSDYARQCLHIVDQPLQTATSDDDCHYAELILDVLHQSHLLVPLGSVGRGGLFFGLQRSLDPSGFDILAPREVRLDAFLFGEERGRYLVAVSEEHDDQFLLKMDEARLNCCFLGRQTSGRILVDGFDFGPTSLFQARRQNG